MRPMIRALRGDTGGAATASALGVGVAATLLLLLLVVAERAAANVAANGGEVASMRTDEASIQPLNAKQVQDLNELMARYEQNMDLLAARKSLAEAIVSRVVIDAIANQRSPVDSINELINGAGGSASAADGPVDGNPDEETAARLRAFIESAAADEISTEKRAPAMGSAYLQPANVAALMNGGGGGSDGSSAALGAAIKRPMMYNAHSFGFGLGKRQHESANRFANNDGPFGGMGGSEPVQLVAASNALQAQAGQQFGKRPSAHRFDFGLGKRKSSYPRYDFGLGKRSI